MELKKLIQAVAVLAVVVGTMFGIDKLVTGGCTVDKLFGFGIEECVEAVAE